MNIQSKPRWEPRVPKLSDFARYEREEGVKTCGKILIKPDWTPTRDLLPLHLDDINLFYRNYNDWNQ
jgi:hypothetical protein